MGGIRKITNRQFGDNLPGICNASRKSLVLIEGQFSPLDSPVLMLIIFIEFILKIFLWSILDEAQLLVSGRGCQPPPRHKNLIEDLGLSQKN